MLKVQPQVLDRQSATGPSSIRVSRNSPLLTVLDNKMFSVGALWLAEMLCPKVDVEVRTKALRVLMQAPSREESRLILVGVGLDEKSDFEVGSEVFYHRLII